MGTTMLFFLFSSTALLWPLLQQGQQTGSLDCSLRRGASWFLKWGEGRGCVQGSLERWFRRFAHPPLKCRGACTVPCFCFGLFRRGLWGLSTGLLVEGDLRGMTSDSPCGFHCQAPIRGDALLLFILADDSG